MTVFKKLIVLSFLILLQSSCSSETVNHQQNNILTTSNQSDSRNYSQYLGKWSVDTYDSNQEPISSLSVDIDDLSTSNIEGKYCYISRYGKKIDCLNDFQGFAIGDNQYLITFDSSFDNIQGKAILTLEEKKVIWMLKEFPADLGVSARKHAILLKDKNQQISKINADSELHAIEYIINVERAFIYKQPNINSKTSSYFIAGDEIEVLSTKDDWVETSYLKGSKTGWLRLKDLEEKKYSNSTPKELTSSKIKNASESIQLVKSNQKKYVLNKDGISNISLGQKFKPNEFTKFESQLEGVDNCFLANSNLYPDHQYSLSFQFFGDLLTGVSVSKGGTTNFDSFTSYMGVKIGDTVETVMKLHNKQPDETLDSPHTDDPIFIYWTDSSKKIGMRYDTVNGEVSSMSLNYSGFSLKEIQGNRVQMYM